LNRSAFTSDELRNLANKPSISSLTVLSYILTADSVAANGIVEHLLWRAIALAVVNAENSEPARTRAAQITELAWVQEIIAS
jgi:hypothetical protein